MEKETKNIVKAGLLRPSLETNIERAKAKFKQQLQDKDYNFCSWVFRFDVGEVFKELYKQKHKREYVPTDNEPIYVFDEEANFGDARFQIETHFDNVSFLEKAIFKSCTFVGKASFKATSFVGEAIFLTTTFEKGDFCATTFQSKVHFNSATFWKEAAFRNVLFLGEVDSVATKYMNIASFIDCRFENTALFKNAVFNNEISILSSMFLEKVTFDAASFVKELNFRNSVFSGAVSFRSTFIEGRAYFGLNTFENIVNFTKASFNDAPIIFVNSTFRSMLYIMQCSYVYSKITFEKATFQRPVFFTDSVFEELLFRSCLIGGQIFLPNKEKLQNPQSSFLIKDNTVILATNEDIYDPRSKFYYKSKHETVAAITKFAPHIIRAKEIETEVRKEIKHSTTKLVDAVLKRGKAFYKHLRRVSDTVFNQRNIYKLARDVWYCVTTVYRLLSIFIGNILQFVLQACDALFLYVPRILCKCSTNNGKRWWQGVFFTYAMAHLFLLQDHLGGVKIEYPLNLTKHFYYILPFNSIEIYPWSYYMVGIVARIMVLYGIYRTVVAFKSISNEKLAISNISPQELKVNVVAKPQVKKKEINHKEINHKNTKSTIL